MSWISSCVIATSAPLHSRFHTDKCELATLHTQYRLIIPPPVPTCRSEQLESKISESTPKKDADVESKEEEENMPNDSAAKEPVGIAQEQQ